MVAQSANLLFTRAYYASGKTRIPLIASGGSAVFTIVASYVVYKLLFIMPYFHDFMVAMLRLEEATGTEILALPLAFSVGSLLNLWIFMHLFNREFKNLYASVRDTFFQGLVASFAAAVASYIMLLLIGSIVLIDTLPGVFSQGFIAGLSGIAVWYWILHLLKSREAEELLIHIKSRIWRIKIIVPEKTEI